MPMFARAAQLAPVAGWIAFAVAPAHSLPPFVMALVLTALVLATVHRAETVADRVGEPHRARILAISVTVISLGLILPILLAIGALVIVPKSTAVVRATDANHCLGRPRPAFKLLLPEGASVERHPFAWA
jgi:Ca2+/H+ antiporter